MAVLGEVTRFGIVGLITNGLLYLIYVALVQLVRQDPVIASGSIYILGVLINYLFHTKYTFEKDNYKKLYFYRHVLTYIAGFLLTILGMMVLLNFIDKFSAQIIMMLVVAAMSFLLMKFYVYHEPQNNGE